MNRNIVVVFAVLCLFCAAPVMAQPSLNFVDNLDGSVTLQVIPGFPPGSVATEITTSISVGDLNITGASVNSLVFDLAIPGNNPFTGGVTSGLWQNGNDIFASFGSIVLSSGSPVDFLQLSYEGTGTIEATGLIAEESQIYGGQFASIELSTIPEPSTAALAGLVLTGLMTRRLRRR